MALKGAWRDEQIFEIDGQTVGMPEHYTIRVSFQDDRIRITFYERGAGTTQTIRGWFASQVQQN
jgi:hypothetical protein